MDYPHWVTFTSPDAVATGYDTGTALFEALGGEGKIAVEGGLEANTSSINRIKGLEKALEEYPDIEVVDTQYCDWDMTKALETAETWLYKYPDINGIWCADDTMALGTVQALQNAGKNGEIYVTGAAGTVDAMDAIEAGDMFATWDVGGYNQGYYTTAYAVAALIGVIDTESMSLEERQFLTAGQVITLDNLEEMRNQLANLWIQKLSIKCDTAKQMVLSLSGGNVQKVVFSRVFSSGAEILILNHPTRGVDIGAKEEIYSFIRDMTNEGAAVILLSDTLDECIGLSSDILVMKDGYETHRFTAILEQKPEQDDVVQYML